MLAGAGGHVYALRPKRILHDAAEAAFTDVGQRLYCSLAMQAEERYSAFPRRRFPLALHRPPSRDALSRAITRVNTNIEDATAR